MPDDEQKDPGQPKKRLGIPYDFRKPSIERAKSRMWNPDDPRLFPPKSFGWGWTLNFYWLAHPIRWIRKGS
jgi:uncharacterized membrane protein